MTTSIQDLDVSEDLKKYGVTRLAKESSRILLEFQNKSIIIFGIEDHELFATLQDFEDRSKGKIDRKTQEAIKYCLSKDEYYVDVLLSKSNGRGAPMPVTIPEEPLPNEDGEYFQAEVLSAEQAIRRNKGRFTVPGMIIGLSTVEQMVTSTEFKCSNCNYSHQVSHNPPLFSLPFSLSPTRMREMPFL